MNILGGLLVGIFSGLTDFFVRFVTKKTALGAAAVTVFSGLTLALFASIGALLQGIVAVFPTDSAILMGLWVAIPDNTQAVVSAVIAADTAVALYRWNVENLRLLSYIT